jgi:HEAT repeat protein
MAAWNAERAAADKAHQEWEKANKDKPQNQKTPPPPGPYTKPLKPWTLWRMEETGGGSPTGIVAYNEGALPDEFHENIFACEWGKGQMERFVVHRSGGTYKLAKREVLLGGGNEPLRPVGVDVLQDGSGILVTDWNYVGWRNPNVDAGRLLKVTYTGKLHATTKPSWYVPAAEGKPFEATTPELISALSHPSESVRLVAQRRLIDRGQSVIEPLLAVLRDTSVVRHAKWHVIWALDGIDAKLRDPLIAAAIINVVQDTQQDVTVRIQAARELGTRQTKAAVPALIAAMDEDHEALRLASATALGRIGDPRAIQALIDHLSEADLFTHFTIFTALHRIALTYPDAWGPIVKAIDSEQSGVRPGVCLAMHEAYEPELIDKLAAFITSSVVPAARVAAIETNAPLQFKRQPWTPTTQDLKWWRTMPARNAAPPRDQSWSGTETVKTALQQALGDSDKRVRHAVVAALSIAPNPALSDRLADLFDGDDDVSMRKEIIAALASAKAPVTIRIVREALEKGGKDNQLLNEALNAAQTMGGPVMAAAVTNFVAHKDYPAPAITAALDALAKLPDPQSINIIAKRLDDPDNNMVAAAGRALGAINNQRAIDAATPFLKNSRVEVKRAAIDTLRLIPQPQCVAPLLTVWRDPSVQKEAIVALAAHPDVKALDA